MRMSDVPPFLTRGKSPCLMLENERGIAMVLSVGLIGLISSLGLYLVLESETAFRITGAVNRMESTFNLSEGALQLGLRCIRRRAPLPTYVQLSSPDIQQVESGLPDYMEPQPYGGGTISPRIDYVGYRPNPPPGWMINWQGYSAFHTTYYRSGGQASITLPGQRGVANSSVSALVLRLNR